MVLDKFWLIVEVLGRLSTFVSSLLGRVLGVSKSKGYVRMKSKYLMWIVVTGWLYIYNFLNESQCYRQLPHN